MAGPTSKLIKLQSTAGTGHYYTTRKTRNVTDKMKRMKFDPVVRKHVLYEEKKIK